MLNLEITKFGSLFIEKEVTTKYISVKSLIEVFCNEVGVTSEYLDLFHCYLEEVIDTDLFDEIVVKINKDGGSIKENELVLKIDDLFFIHPFVAVDLYFWMELNL